MRLVSYQDRPVAFVAGGHVNLAPWIAVLEPDHPTRRWVIGLALFARGLEMGVIPGKYSPPRAEHYARCALMPQDEFASLDDQDDVVLAEHFNVPLDQVAERQLDLLFARDRM